MFNGTTAYDMLLQGSFAAKGIYPYTNYGYGLGAATYNFKNLYMDNGGSDGGTLYFNAGGTYLQCSEDGLTLTLSGATLDCDAIGEKTAATGVTIDGALIKDGAFEGQVESKCVDVVQLSNTGISDGDTDTLVFDFVPTKIVLNYSISGRYVGSGQLGSSDGQTVITITGTDTYSSVCNYTVHTVTDHAGVLGNTTNIVAGMVATDPGNATVVAVGVWDTATKTMTLTYAETVTTVATTALLLVATAYR
jgi:hypothetical protein